MKNRIVNVGVVFLSSALLAVNAFAWQPQTTVAEASDSRLAEATEEIEKEDAKKSGKAASDDRTKKKESEDAVKTKAESGEIAQAAEKDTQTDTKKEAATQNDSKKTSGKATQPTAEKKDASTSGGSKPSGSTANVSTKPSTNQSNANTTKPESGASNPSNNTNNSTNSAPTAPAHTHDWQPNYQNVYHDAVTAEVQVCYTCEAKGLEVRNPDAAHKEAHLLAGESSSTHGKTVTVKEAWTAPELVGYICSCGATK